MLNNFAIFSEHVPGSSNCIADALTRFQIQRFREFATGGSNSTWIVPSTVGDTLDISLDNLWRQSISKNTQTAYNTGLYLYMQLLLLLGEAWSTSSLPPVSEKFLMRFSAYCHEHKQLRYSTIKCICVALDYIII